MASRKGKNVPVRGGGVGQRCRVAGGASDLPAGRAKLLRQCRTHIAKTKNKYGVHG